MIYDEGGTVPYGVTTLGQFALNSAIYARLIGITNAASVLADVKARIIQTNGGADNTHWRADYPEFSWAYVP